MKSIIDEKICGKVENNHNIEINNSTEHSEEEIITTIRKYHDLMKEGIITKDEFDIKKKELL